MRKWVVLLIVFVIPIWAMTACSREKDTAEPVTQKEVKDNSERTESATGSSIQQEMDDFIVQMESQLQRLKGKVEDLKTRAQALRGEAEMAVDEKIDTLEKRQTQAMQKLEALKSGGVDSWEDAKFELQSAILRFNQALQDAASELK